MKGVAIQKESNSGSPAYGKICDTSGASIVIALVFFLICAVVGSVVLTASSINAQAVATHRDTQQAEYAVSSAAQLVADQLVPDPLNPPSIAWSNFSSDNTPEKMKISGNVNDLMSQIWEGTSSSSAQFKGIWKKRNAGESFYLNGAPGASGHLTIAIKGADGADIMTPVFAWVSIDRDFNIRVELSTDAVQANVSAYKQTVTVQCIPTYNSKGQMTSCKWSAAAIVKTNQDASQAGGA